MVNWKIAGPIIAAIIVIIIVVVVIIILNNNKDKNDDKNIQQQQQTFVPPLAKRERYIKNSQSDSLNQFIQGYIDVENGNWN